MLTEQLAAVVSLCKAEHFNQEISNFIGDNLRSVQRSAVHRCAAPRWAKVARDSDGTLSLQNKPPSKAKTN